MADHSNAVAARWHDTRTSQSSDLRTTSPLEGTRTTPPTQKRPQPLSLKSSLGGATSESVVAKVAGRSEFLQPNGMRLDRSLGALLAAPAEAK